VPHGTARPFAEALDEIGSRLKRRIIPPKAILGRLSVIDETSRLTGPYQDPDYLPFYFHAGRVLDPRRIICVGLDIGLHVSCLLQGCSEPECCLCVQPPSSEYYSPRIALSNIRSVTSRRFPVSAAVSRLEEVEFPAAGFDMALITSRLPGDSTLDSLEACWRVLSDDGTILVDRLSEGSTKEVFADFCKAKNVEFRAFETRYGTALARK